MAPGVEVHPPGGQGGHQGDMAASGSQVHCKLTAGGTLDGIQEYRDYSPAKVDSFRIGQNPGAGRPLLFELNVWKFTFI